MKILFFGDSITDASRDRADPADLGVGYVKIAAGKLRLLYPDLPLEFVNRGVGGDRTAELLARVDEDVVAERPDVVVLQVGINDVWCRFSLGEVVSPEQFRENYLTLVKKIKATGAKLLLVQPFVLSMGDKSRFRPYVRQFNTIIREIATEEGVPFVPTDEIFDGLVQDIAPSQFATDGVHPTHRGCRYIADLVIKELKKNLA